MNYEILIGKTVNLKGTDIQVSSIKPITGPDYVKRYCVNDGPLYSKVEIGTCVSIVENEIEEANYSKGIFSFITNKFGLFIRKFNLIEEELSHTEKSIFFQKAYGIRSYGYRKVGFFFHIRIGLTVRQIEFCWNEKKLYNKGVLPESLAEFNKIF